MVTPPEPPPVQSRPGAPPVQRRHPEPPPSEPSKWNWWPDHPGKRVMVAATVAWVALLPLVFLYGFLEGRAVMSSLAPETAGFESERAALLMQYGVSGGLRWAGSITWLYVLVLIVGGAMAWAIEKKPSGHAGGSH